MFLLVTPTSDPSFFIGDPKGFTSDPQNPNIGDPKGVTSDPQNPNIGDPSPRGSLVTLKVEKMNLTPILKIAYFGVPQPDK